MKKSFKLEGLCCPNCAAKIEDGIRKTAGVTAVTLNFATTKLTIEADEANMDGIITAAKAIIKRVEPDVVMQKA